MRIIFLAACLACVFLATLRSGWAQGNSSQATPAHADASAEDELKSLELKLADLIVRGDWDEYEKYLAADYTRVAGDGKLENRDEVMSNFRKGPRKIIVMEPEDLRVRIYGDAAVMQGHVTTSVRESGHVNTRNERFTGVFVRQDGQWRMAAEHETAVGK
jgi:ketosteroid isomerase-like protein